MPGYSKESLYGHWAHSHEEDTESETVFRPATHAFPPARGRTTLELRPDGTYLERYPGPVDVPEESSGRWSLEADRLALDPEGDRPGQAWRLLGVEDDRLRLSRLE